MLVWLAVLAFMAASGLAAARLLLLWSDSRQLPELLIAILILGVGTIAVGGGFLVSKLTPPGPMLEITRFIPTLGAVVGMIALCIFTWRVYRNESVIARGVAALFIGGLTCVFAVAVFHGSVDAISRPPYQALNFALYVGVMLWSASEAFVYWLPMRRRLRLGLADAIVVNRVFLWGLATGTAGIGIAIGATGVIATTPGELPPAWVSINFAVFGMVSAIGFWLAFKPPHAYARWIEARGAKLTSAREEPAR